MIDRLEAFEDRNSHTARVMVVGLVVFPLLWFVSGAGYVLWAVSAGFGIGIGYMEGLGLLYLTPLVCRRGVERESVHTVSAALLMLACAAGVGTLVYLAFTGPLTADPITFVRLSAMGFGLGVTVGAARRFQT